MLENSKRSFVWRQIVSSLTFTNYHKAVRLWAILYQNFKKRFFKFLQIKKIEADKIAVYYSYSEKTPKISDCSVTLWRETWEHISTLDKKELYSSNNCQLRFCPVCSWRKALKSSAILYTNLSKMENVNFLFLTLTLKNCEILDLKDTLKLMSQSFDRLRKLNNGKNIKGYIRALEITVSKMENAPPFSYSYSGFSVLWEK